MVNAFTASTVMQSFTKKYRFQTRSYEPDGVGGFVSGWKDGPEFEAVERHDTTVEAQVAEQADTASTWSTRAYRWPSRTTSSGWTAGRLSRSPARQMRAKPRRNPAWDCGP